MSTMYGYYEQQPILPTFADLHGEVELNRYAMMRRRVYERVMLPRRLFAGANILQFGPDSGEDALVFARDGARMTLVEPNPKVHDVIRAYFREYDLESHLASLEVGDVLSFESPTAYDFIDAEGFIYTVQPTRDWLAAFNRLLVPGGLALITYYERHGALIELALKALYNLARRFDGRTGIEVARALYATKWNSIPHTRRFESWVMDVMENPFVRDRYFLTADGLCDEAERHGLLLYSAWPTYNDPLEVYWHKRDISRDQLRDMRRRHITRSVLSFVAGSKLYLSGDYSKANAILHIVSDLMSQIDACIDVGGEQYISRVIELFQALRSAVEEAPISGEPGRRETAASLFRSLQFAFEATQRHDSASLYRLTSEDDAFIQAWGMPSHVAVFAKSNG